MAKKYEIPMVVEPPNGRDPRVVHYKGSALLDFATLCGACWPDWEPGEPKDGDVVGCIGCLEVVEFVTRRKHQPRKYKA